MKTCSIYGCENDPAIKGLCRKHYMRQRRNGDPNEKKRPGPKPVESLLGSEVNELLNMIAPRTSARTVARLRRALALLPYIRKSERTRILGAWQSNGFRNMARLLRDIEEAALRQLARKGAIDHCKLNDYLNNPGWRKERAFALDLIRIRPARSKRMREVMSWVDETDR
jgi:hypothetical protein